MFCVIKSGIQTTVQDADGRKGFAHLGFPPSGAMDGLALTIANTLVGNDPNEAGLEFAFSGPNLIFERDSLFSVTGAVRSPTLDEEPVPMYKAMKARKGQTLALSGFCTEGQWGYVAFGGGIDVPLVMNSKSTFATVTLGGFEGRTLQAGDILTTGESSFENCGVSLREDRIPKITNPMEVELMHGYFTDYLSDRDIEMMYATVWTIQPDSSRLGYRLSGPEFEFSEKARGKGSASGAFPSNIFDAGYPSGAINLAGQTPIILAGDGPTCGGYMCPFKIPSSALWKIGQCRIGGSIRFKFVDQEGAARLRKEFHAYKDSGCYTI
jgi:urea carboxylase